MKRKDLLLLTLLLTQTTPVLGMWNIDDENAIAIASNGRPRPNVHSIAFEDFLPSGIPALVPSDPLPQNLGTARQRVQCTFANNVIENILLPTEYPLQGQWDFQEDRNNAQDIATLKLKALLTNQRQVEVYQRQVSLPHTLINAGVETLDGYYFNGDKVCQARSKQQQWRNPRSQQSYARTIPVLDGEIPSHKDYQTIYVEPFAFANEPPRANKDAYRGEYHFIRDLSEHEGLPGKKLESLLYSDGQHVYLPHVTQELWRQDQSQVGFFIASYKQDRKLNFISQAGIPGGQLPEGLYQMFSVQEEPNRRIEKWKKLGEDPQNVTFVEIGAPAGVSSIPGMGGLVPREVPNNTANFELIQLQKGAQERNRIIEENAKHYPNVRNSIIVLGPSKAGKSTLIQGLAGNLNAQLNDDRDLRLYAENPLPGFTIGQDFGSETKVPGFLHDLNESPNGRFFIDCQGFEDSTGDAADIINAFAINKLFENSTVKVVLVAQESSITNQPTDFLKLLNQITALYEDESQLQSGLSIVFTRGSKIHPHVRIKAFSRFLNANQTTISPSAQRLVEFLAREENKPRFCSLPAPQDEGPYQFNRDGFFESINSTQYVDSPKVKISVSAGAKLLAADLAQNLNGYLTNYMKTEGPQRIINYCRHKIDTYSGPIAKLRAEFKQLKKNLKTLKNVPSDMPLRFVNILSQLIDTDEIKKTIDLLGFLKTIKDDVNYNVADWSKLCLTTLKPR